MIELDKIYNMEVWKSVPKYEGIIEVSSLGRVKKLARTFIKSNGRRCIVKECILKPFPTRTGYLLVHITKGKYEQVHRLIAMAFIPCEDYTLEVNHKDENKKNNEYTNLEWCTHKYNSSHGTRNVRIGKTLLNGTKSLPVLSNKGERFDSIHDAARKLNGSAGNIVKQLKGETKTAYGRTWRYDR